MKTLNLFFNSSEKNFRKDCKSKKIRSKIIKRGSGYRRCTGKYTYRWIETDMPNYDMYILYLEQGKSVEVFFYTEDDRTKFLEDLLEKIHVNEIDEYEADDFYKKGTLYGVELKL